MDPLLAVAVAAIGALAGLFAGLLGIGGGVVMTPLLIVAFEYGGMAPADAALAAIATSLAAVLFTSLAGASVHASHGSLDWRLLAWVAPPSALGATVAGNVAPEAPPEFLVLLLVVLLCVAAHRVLRSGGDRVREGARPRPLPVAATGLAAGVIGAFTGTGGGMVVTPLLARMGVPLIKAIGTSSGNIAAISLFGTIAFAGAGLNYPALAALAPSCLVMSMVGARLANRLPRERLKAVYAACLLVFAARLAYWLVVQSQA